jgi:UDP-N-acetylmuramate dehydrogenase
MDGGFLSGLRRAMPDLRGTLAAAAPLAPLSWFKTGGPAQVLFSPADEADLAYFLENLDSGIPVLTIGAGSNLLIRDGGVDGVVIQLGKPFAGLNADGLLISAGAAVPDVKLASSAAQAGIAGFSFLRGIPGSVGGALRMNAGAYGAEIKDILISARGIGRDGTVHTFTAQDMGFTYRHCGVPDDIIFTSAVLRGQPGNPEAIRAEMAEVTQARTATQPVNQRTGGSTFKNPAGEKAWALIDRAGCRGLIHGGAQVSELHTNFMINRGNATAADLEDLGEIVRARVFERSGVVLEWEIARIGRREQGSQS